MNIGETKKNFASNPRKLSTFLPSFSIPGFSRININTPLQQRTKQAMTAIGRFLQNTNEKVKDLGITKEVSRGIGKVGIDGVSYSSIAIIQTGNALKSAELGGAAIKGLAQLGNTLGTAIGVTTILTGLRSLAAGARCYSRASHLDSCAKQMDTKSSVQKQLAEDLAACAKLNRIRGKDKAICGAIDVGVGVSTLAAGACTSGVAAPFVGLISWGAGQVAKNSLRTFRTHQNTPAQQVQREHISHRLKDHVEFATTEVTAGLPDGKTISSDTQARLKAFQSVGLISSKTDITKASPALAKQLESITPEKIESKFTENTETFTLESAPNATTYQRLSQFAGKAILSFS